MAKLQRFIPQSPDPYLKQADQLGAVKFGHLNALVDSINSTVYGDYLQLAGSGPMSTTLRALEDPEGNLAQLYLAVNKTAISGPLKVGDSTANDASAILEISSTTKGVLFPKMTIAERDAIVSPAIGLLIYNTEDLILNQWDGTEWTEVGGGGGLGLLDDALITSTLTQVVDKDNTASALLLSTERIGLSSDPTATTQTTAVIQATTTNSGIALVPNGTGAITASIPGGTNGGNARGQYAVDLQMSRNPAKPQEVASGNYSIIIGGSNNKATGNYSISGGNYCDALGENSVVFGLGNTASATQSVISGGYLNNASGIQSGIVSGRQNQVSGQYAFIGGGYLNVNSSLLGVISGGQSNTASTGTYATVVGGQSNVASSTYATVLNGFSNNSSGDYSLTGGSNSLATSPYSIAIGQSALAMGSKSLCLNGGSAQGASATALAGVGNNAIGDYALAQGYVTETQLRGQITFSGTGWNFPLERGYCQQSLLTANREATISTGSFMKLSLDGTGVTNLIIPFGNNRAWNAKVETIAVVTGITGTVDGVSVGDALMQDDTLLFTRVGGASSVVGVNNTNIIASTSMGTSSMSYSAGASQELAIAFNAPTFTGGGSVTVRVVSKVSLVEVAW